MTSLPDADQFPLAGDRLSVRWWRRRNGWHIWLQFTSQDETSAEWAYGTFGARTVPGAQESLLSALSRAGDMVMRNAEKAGVEWSDPRVSYPEREQYPNEIVGAITALADRLGWPCVADER